MARNEKVNQPISTAGMEFVSADVDTFFVGEWHRLSDGSDQPTEVHLYVNIEGLPAPLGMRFKDADTVDKLVSALVVHRQSVWPEVPK